jgi:hypothetical protein
LDICYAPDKLYHSTNTKQVNISDSTLARYELKQTILNTIKLLTGGQEKQGNFSTDISMV